VLTPVLRGHTAGRGCTAGHGRRTGRGHTARRGHAARPARRSRWRRAACLLTALTPALALATAGPAAADSVRNQQMWVLNAVHAPAAWGQTRGQGVTVAVIDSGVNPGVSDLAGSVQTGPDLSGVHTPPSDSAWGVHGTWMASLIAGHGHDGGSAGIMGVAPAAKILSIRVVTDQKDPGFGRYEQEPSNRVQHALARAIRYATAHHVSVISMSLGYGAASRPVRSAILQALNGGVVVVASSGNSGAVSGAQHRKPAPYSYPADYPGVLGVAAVGRDGAPAPFSSDNLSVEVAAPGVQVPAQGRDGQYWLVSGTSPACALTAGVAALVKSRYPHLAPALVVQAIAGSTTNRPRGGYNDEVGFGTVDASAALAASAPLAGSAGQRSGLTAAAHYGGGPSAVPPVPVSPRDSRPLALYLVLALASLVLVVAAAVRLVAIRRRPTVSPRPW
jgi:subtilisin family serine protease